MRPLEETRQRLTAGQLSTQVELQLEASFLMPWFGAGQNDAVAHFVFEPLDSAVSAEPAIKTTGEYESSAEFESPRAFVVPVSGLKEAERVTLPVRWTVTGSRGAALRLTVFVRAPNGLVAGKAAFVVAVSAEGRLASADSMQVFEAQRAALAADARARGRLLSAGPEDQVPFVPANHAAALARESERYDREVKP